VQLLEQQCETLAHLLSDTDPRGQRGGGFPAVGELLVPPAAKPGLDHGAEMHG